MPSWKKLITSGSDASINDLTLSGDFIAGNNSVKVLASNGRVGINTLSPGHKLTVAGNASFNEYLYHNGDTDTHVRFQADQVDISAGGNVYSYDGSNLDVTGGVRATGDVVAFYSSDKRLKDNIVRIENPLEKVGKIGGYTYDWNDKQDTYEVGSKDFGVIAQEIQEVLPELVTERDNGFLAVKYEKIVPLLIESIKELKQEVDEIKQKCDCLNK